MVALGNNWSRVVRRVATIVTRWQTMFVQTIANNTVWTLSSTRHMTPSIVVLIHILSCTVFGTFLTDSILLSWEKDD